MQPEEHLLHTIAQHCPAFEDIAEAQGYGISFQNTNPTINFPRCNCCVNWFEGACDLFQGYSGDVGADGNLSYTRD